METTAICKETVTKLRIVFLDFLYISYCYTNSQLMFEPQCMHDTTFQECSLFAVPSTSIIYYNNHTTHIVINML